MGFSAPSSVRRLVFLDNVQALARLNDRLFVPSDSCSSREPLSVNFLKHVQRWFAPPLSLEPTDALPINKVPKTPSAFSDPTVVACRNMLLAESRHGPQSGLRRLQ